MNNSRFFPICFSFFIGLILIACQRPIKATTDKGQTFKIILHESKHPESEEEFWRLANRLLQPGDFDDDWLSDSYILYLGTMSQPSPWPHENAMGMRMCSTEGISYRRKINQQPYCIYQDNFKYPNKELAKEHYDIWLSHYNDFWDDPDEYFSVTKQVDHLAIACGIASERPEQGYYEETHYCDVKLANDEYFVYIESRFTLDEEPINREEIGELIQLIQEKMLALDADQIPAGLKAPVDFGPNGEVLAPSSN